MVSVADLSSFKNVPVSASVLVVSNLFFLTLFLEWSVLTIFAYTLILGLIAGFAYTKVPGLGAIEFKAEVLIEEIFAFLKECTLALLPFFRGLFTWTDPYLSIYFLVGSYIFTYIAEWISLIFVLWLGVNGFFLYGAKKTEIDALAKPHLEKVSVQAKELISKIPRAPSTEKKST